MTANSNPCPKPAERWVLWVFWGFFFVLVLFFKWLVWMVKQLQYIYSSVTILLILYLFSLILFVSKNVIFVVREMDSCLVWHVKWCANGWVLCRAVGACVWWGALELWGCWIFLFVLMLCWQSDWAFWECFSHCSSFSSWGNEPLNILLFMQFLVWSLLPDLKLSCLQFQINKSLSSKEFLGHHRAKLELISGLVGNLTPSCPGMSLGAGPIHHCQTPPVPALDAGGPNLPCPSPLLLNSSFLPDSSLLSNACPAVQS